MKRSLLVGILVFVGCAHTTAPASSSTATIRGEGGRVVVSVEVADTPAARAQGLMGRTELPAAHGMVFLFPDAGGTMTERFWMKDTEVPLSIAFWGADGSILAIHDMDPCTVDPCPTYGSPSPYVGALEVNQGFFEEHGIRVGDHIELT